MEIGLGMFWFIPLFLGFVIAFVFMRFSNKADESDESAAQHPESARRAAPTNG